MTPNTQTATNHKTWTKKDLKNAYNINYRTLLEWLRRIPGLMSIEELKRTRKFTPKQTDKIFSHIGHP